MAENKDPEDKPGVYDDNEPGWKTNLGNEGDDGGEAKSSSDTEGEPKDQKDSDPASAKELGQAEQSAESGPPGPAVSAAEAGWYKDLDSPKGFRGTSKMIVKGLLTKKGAAGIGIGGGVIGITIGVIMFLLPLKLNMIMENLQDKYFSGNENVLEERTEKMFSHYVKKMLLPALVKPGCNRTRSIDKNCVAVSPGDSPFDKLANAWRDARLENRMAEKYGIELSYEPGSTDFTLRVNDKVSNIDIEGFRKNANLDLWQATGSRSDIRRSIAKSLEAETGFKKMYYRYKVGSLLERKYGIRRCFVYCDARDRFADNRQERRNARKIAFYQKVTFGRIESLSIAMQCITDPSCTSSTPDRDGNDASDFERRNALQKNINKMLVARGKTLGAEKIADIATKVNKIGEAGSFGKYLAGELAEKVAGTAGKKFAIGAIPVIGWIDLAATLIHTSATVGPALKTMNYDMMSSTAVATFTMYRSYADEQKRGLTHPDVAASYAEGLGSTVGDADHIGQNAEMSPVYGELFGSQTPVQTALAGIFPTASAMTQNRGYTCEDNQPPPNGKLACEVEEFTIDNVATVVGDAFDVPGLSQLKSVAGYWSAISNAILAPVGDALMLFAKSIPGYDQLEAAIGEWAGELLTSLGKKIFKDPAGNEPSGARTMQLLAAGADVSAATSAEFALGGSRITDQESVALLEAQEQKKQQDFANKPIFARMFDKEDSRSMVGQIAMAIPIGATNSGPQLAANLTSNPLNVIGNSFASLFTGRAKASTGLPNAFRIVRSGYPLNDPARSIDPSTLTKAYCSNFNKQWADDVQLDKDTGKEFHTYVNPCMLDSAVTVAAGGSSSKEALEDEPVIDDGLESATPPLAEVPPGTPPGQPPVGNTYASTTCPANTDVTPSGGEDGYSGGKPFKIRICKVQGITVNATIAANVDRLLTASKDAGVPLTGGGFRSMAGQIAARKANGCPDIYNAPSRSCRVPTARPGFSNHQMGHAIDFKSCGRSSKCFQWLSANAATYGLKNLPSESWHWSVNGN